MTVKTPERLDAHVRAAIADIAAGRLVIVTDDEDRENEGDLIGAAAAMGRAEVAFMVRHTTGILCAAMDPARCAGFDLPPMVQGNQDPNGTAYTVSCDAAACGTGVSAQDRLLTLRTLAGHPDPAALRRPGHMFPLRAQPGGVLARPGHTEAAWELANRAGLPGVGVLAELVNDDGSMMRGPALQAFASRHGLRQLAITELIAWRLAGEGAAPLASQAVPDPMMDEVA
ncbi:3,4-dihydroxy-2-butanone-4-phosphate synthase [Paracoccus sp. PS-1]|uniref:3,4-dihydroxy-2-butanone-4-phosphate synthase n=1 Tax=unclassified Paracoccus (in: a-proteobacteria) TaxID=2688777 RepID=UPI0004ACA226|nr:MULTISPECIES: 3,4-dihydroxy-2-butanone-4-phosphate synthase [unclassified Paracoccus (in: a-proteobacteria)]MDQ7263028.1 3,4-dihydroxy-2-butanone-4-phosphate synthase [Paracoccus sp. PS1]